MLARFLPRTLVGQLVVMLACVLTLGQMVNLALLVGTQRLQARSIAYNSAVEQSVEAIANLPETLPNTLPYQLRQGRGGQPGLIFLSSEDRASNRKSGIPMQLPRYNDRFKAALAAQGIEPLATRVTFLETSPSLEKSPSLSAFPKTRRDLGPPPRGPKGRPPRPDSGPDSEQRDIQGGLGPLPPPGPPGRFRPEDGPPDFGRQGFGLPTPARGAPLPLQEIRLSAELESGVWFNAVLPLAETEALTGRIILATLSLLGASLLAVWFLARRISRPISQFTRAAEKLGRGDEPQLLAETGADDIKRAASAFNTMQIRLTRMLETQRNMLRAVGHDLRTPLTSLRIRAEKIADEIEREKVIATLNDMSVMTEEILSWGRDASGTEALARVDLRSLLESLVDDYQDQGQDVKLTDFAPVTVTMRRTAIKRALQNLINNALQYGSNAALSVDIHPDRITIYVDDDGGGVPTDQLDTILKPFVRLETSRSKATGGTGLGLSIVDTIAKIHGGSLTLSNRKPQGFRAALSLPF